MWYFCENERCGLSGPASSLEEGEFLCPNCGENSLQFEAVAEEPPPPSFLCGYCGEGCETADHACPVCGWDDWFIPNYPVPRPRWLSRLLDRLDKWLFPKRGNYCGW